MRVFLLVALLLLAGCATPAPEGPTTLTSSSPAPGVAASTPVASPPGGLDPAAPAPSSPPPTTPPTPVTGPVGCAPGAGPTFTHGFVDVSQVTYITPLGNLNVGSQGRTYVHVVPGEDGERNLIPLTMPADGALKRLAYALRGSGPEARAQWRLEFDLPCALTLVFDHVQDVVPAIANVTPAEPATATNVVMSVDVPFRAGDLIGHPNGTDNSGGFDFYLIDWTYEAPHANASRWSTEHHVHAVCPYDRFTPALRATYYALFASQGGVRMAEPSCRSVVVDVPGTLAGAWFLGDASANRGERLAVAADSDGSVNVQIDHADGRREPIRIYPPTTDPATVTAGGEACWDGDGDALWMRLESATRALVARAPSCEGAFPASSGVAYDR